MKEVLAVPEEYLEEVIKVIRNGLKRIKIKKEVRYNLNKWCDEEEGYLKSLGEEG